MILKLVDAAREKRNKKKYYINVNIHININNPQLTSTQKIDFNITITDNKIYHLYTIWNFLHAYSYTKIL